MGRTVRQIAALHGLSVAATHRVVRHVHMQLLRPWHRARLPREAPLPPLECVHALLARE
ncbi:hypothetical protein [Extensimonas vulgaris]|uniref:hypothetical protein n=1 Tax=Extensimonas vulgaris TaxID=1031594 RepID=UPI0013159C82|nr:hypothetical protein [Extensimonas vulgaris]